MKTSSRAKNAEKTAKPVPFDSGTIIVIKKGSMPGKILGSTGKKKEWKVLYVEDGDYKTGTFTSGQMRHPQQKDKIFQEQQTGTLFHFVFYFILFYFKN